MQGDLVVRRLDDGRLLTKQRNEVGPTLHRLVLRGELVGGVEVVRLDREDLIEGVDDHHVELQTISIDLDHLAQDGDLVLGRDPFRLLDAFLHHLDEGVPSLRLLVQGGELAPRRPFAGRRRDQFLPGVDPLVDRLLRRFGGCLRFVGELLGQVVGVRSAVAVAVRSRGLLVLLALPVALALALLRLLIHLAPPIGSCRLRLLRFRRPKSAKQSRKQSGFYSTASQPPDRKKRPLLRRRR